MTDWRFNPVHDDGTPKGPPDYFHHNPVLAATVDEAQRAIEELQHDCAINPEPNPEPEPESELDLEAAKQETEAQQQIAEQPAPEINADSKDNDENDAEADIQIIPARHTPCENRVRTPEKCNILSHSDAFTGETVRSRLAPKAQARVPSVSPLRPMPATHHDCKRRIIWKVR